MDNQVPLWAFLIAATAGPAIGAAIAVPGTWLTNRHSARENARSRALERHRIRAQTQQTQVEIITRDRINVYKKVIEQAQIMRIRLFVRPSHEEYVNIWAAYEANAWLFRLYADGKAMKVFYRLSSIYQEATYYEGSETDFSSPSLEEARKQFIDTQRVLLSYVKFSLDIKDDVSAPAESGTED